MYTQDDLLDVGKHPCLHAELDRASDSSAQNLYNKGSVKHNNIDKF